MPRPMISMHLGDFQRVQSGVKHIISELCKKDSLDSNDIQAIKAATFLLQDLSKFRRH